MKKLQKEKFEESGDNLPNPKIKLSKRTRIVTFIFSVMTILITAGIMQAANVYYDLDTSTIMVNDAQTMSLGLTVSGAAVSLNNSSNFATGINTGTSTGAVTIGGGSNTVAVDSTNWDISTGGNFSTAGTVAIKETGASPTYYTIFQGGDQTAASNITYTLPTALPGATGYSLVSSDTGVLSWAASVAGTAHPLLGATSHSDTVTSTVDTGDLVIGTAGGWDDLAISATSGTVLQSNGTTAVWSTVDYPDTTTANQLLFSSANNVVGGVTAGTDGQFLVASATGVPTFVTASSDATIANTGAITLASGITRDTEWDTEAEMQTAWGGVNILLATEIDTSNELLTIMGDETGSGLLVFGTAPTFSSNITIGTSSTTLGQIVIKNATNANTQTIEGSAAGGNYTYVLPSTQGGTFAMTSDINAFEASGILRGQVNIFGFDYPAQCSTSCVTPTYKIVSREIQALPNFPAVLANATRTYRLVIRYGADLNADGDDVTVVAYNVTTPGAIATWTIDQPTAAGATVEKGYAYVTTDFTAPATDDWDVRVGVPASGVVRIYSIDLAAYDIN